MKLNPTLRACRMTRSTSPWRMAAASLVVAALAGSGATAYGQEQETEAPRRERLGQRLAERRSDASEEGFQNLLGDQAAALWRGYGSEEFPQGWEIADGMLHRTAAGGDIVTKAEYAHFDFRFEWKVAAGANSGIMYRVSLGDPAPYFSGPEYQILDNERHADGKSPLTSAGSLYAMVAPTEHELKPAGEWNTGRIVVRGKRVRHFVNGQKVVDIRIDSPDWQEALAKSKFKDWEKFGKNAQGHLALQDHGDEVWYRNLRIKPLDPPRGRPGQRAARGAAESTPGPGVAR